MDVRICMWVWVLFAIFSWRLSCIFCCWKYTYTLRKEFRTDLCLSLPFLSNHVFQKAEIETIPFFFSIDINNIHTILRYKDPIEYSLNFIYVESNHSLLGQNDKLLIF
jgi:hypothetical protein